MGIRIKSTDQALGSSYTLRGILSEIKVHARLDYLPVSFARWPSASALRNEAAKRIRRGGCKMAANR